MKSKELSIEELLQDRWIVTGPYPYSPYHIGDLVELSTLGTSFHITTTKEYDQFREDIVDVEKYASIDELEKYKNIFRQLAWYELRSVEEMPEYLKYKTGKINPEYVVYPVSFKKGEFGWDITVEGTEIKSGNYIYLFDKFPADQTEYEQYPLSQSKK